MSSNAKINGYMSAQDRQRVSLDLGFADGAKRDESRPSLGIFGRLAEKMYRLERAAEDAMMALMGADDFDLARKYEPLLPVGKVGRKVA